MIRNAENVKELNSSFLWGLEAWFCYSLAPSGEKKTVQELILKLKSEGNQYV